jgi:hypothetical protein
MSIYPKRWELVVSAVFFAVCAAVAGLFLGLALFALVTGRDAGWIGAGWIGTVLLAAFTLCLFYIFSLFVRGLARHVLEVISTRPLLRMDEDGLECLPGRLNWADVESVGVVHHRELGPGETPRIEDWLLVALRPHAAFLPTSRLYSRLKDDVPRRCDRGLELPLAGDVGRSTVEAFSRYWLGPIEGLDAEATATTDG